MKWYKTWSDRLTRSTWKVVAGSLVLAVCSNAATAQGWWGYGGNPQHTAIAPVTAQPLDTIHWTAPVDLNPQYSGIDLLIHYGTPLITPANTVIIPVKTGASDGFRIDARRGATGEILWSSPTDYSLPPHAWTPSCGPTLLPNGSLAYPGGGGAVYIRSNVDSATGTTTKVVFYGDVNFDSHVKISTPITSDSKGNLYFGFVVLDSNNGYSTLTLKDGTTLSSGLARIDTMQKGAWVSAAAAANNSGITKVATNCAPAITTDDSLVYVAVNVGGGGAGYLVALKATPPPAGHSWLETAYSVRLKDNKTPANDANVDDEGTASPMIGPDGDVYFGVLETPWYSNHLRGWMLHFSSTLAPKGANGAFGWDDTASVVPKAAVPGYTGTSSYLLLTKYNNYVEGGGDGVNKIALLDPNDTMTDPISGATVMKEVYTIAGPTPDSGHVDGNHPNAVREWCINTAVIDVAGKAAFVNNEDGRMYRWDFTTNTLSPPIVLTSGIGEAYTPTVMGPDGVVYGINNATLFAIGADSVDVTSKVEITLGALVANRITRHITQSVTIKNISASPIKGRISLVLDNLTKLAALANRSGTTSLTLPRNSSYIDNTGDLAAGASLVLTLDFTNNSPSAIRYMPRVLAGTGVR